MNNITTTPTPSPIQTSQLYHVYHINSINHARGTIAYVFSEDLSAFISDYSASNYNLYTVKDLPPQDRADKMSSLFMSYAEYSSLPVKPLHAFIYDPITIYDPDNK